MKGDTKMRKLSVEEMKAINGGATMTCSTCGYVATNALLAGLHGGIYPWHFWNGGHWIS